MKVARIFTKKRTAIAVCGIFVVSICLALFPIWTMEADKFPWGEVYCVAIDYYLYYTLLFVATRGLSFIVPAVFLSVFTKLIIKNLRRSARESKRLRGNHEQENRRDTSVETQLTKMLVCVATAFVLLRLPMAVMHSIYMYYIWAYNIFLDARQDWFWYRFDVALLVCKVIDLLNFTINFFLYCVSGSQFRTALREMFSIHNLVCCKRNQTQSSGSAHAGRAMEFALTKS